MGETITVGCKLPNGIELRIFRKEEMEETMAGGATRKMPVAIEIARIKLNGWWHNYGAHKPAVAVESSYGLTHGVDKEQFNMWLEANKNSDLVINKIITAHPNAEVVRKKTEEMNKEVKSGAEPLDATLYQKDGMQFSRDPRFPRGARGQSLIEAGERSQ